MLASADRVSDGVRERAETRQWQFAASGRVQQDGSLVTLVPFVMNHTNAPLRVLELYFADLEGTYVTGYQDTCWASGTSVPYAPYDDVLRAATTP